MHHHGAGGRRPAQPRRLCTGAAFVAILLGTTLTACRQPADAQTWLQTGRQAYLSGRIARAQTAFAKAAASMPESATPAVWMGTVMIAQGDNVHAGHWLRLALLLRPTTDQARYVLALLGRLGHAAPAQNMMKNTTGKWESTSAEGIARFIRASNPAIAPKQAAWEGRAIKEAATKEGVDQRLVTALVSVESNFDPVAVSRVGALGLGQLMPRTAAELGVNPRDPWQNLVGAARLLRLDFAEFHPLPLTLAAYNAGGRAVRLYGGIPPYPETRSYVGRVLAILRGLVV